MMLFVLEVIWSKVIYVEVKNLYLFFNSHIPSISYVHETGTVTDYSKLQNTVCVCGVTDLYSIGWKKILFSIYLFKKIFISYIVQDMKV